MQFSYAICILYTIDACQTTLTLTHSHPHTTHAHTYTHTHTGLTREPITLNSTLEVSSNMFKENVADITGAAVAFPLVTMVTTVTLRSQTYILFQNK